MGKDGSYELVQDHNTTPGSPGTSGSSGGVPDDPECDDEFLFPSGVVSSACTEGSDPNCTDPTRFIHTGVCNSPRHVALTGGAMGRGSALINGVIAIGQLLDGGRCQASNCFFPDCDPDCIPCTDDDLDQGVEEGALLTTGTATGVVLDANNQAGALIA